MELLQTKKDERKEKEMRLLETSFIPNSSSIIEDWYIFHSTNEIKDNDDIISHSEPIFKLDHPISSYSHIILSNRNKNFGAIDLSEWEHEHQDHLNILLNDINSWVSTIYFVLNHVYQFYMEGTITFRLNIAYLNSEFNKRLYETFLVGRAPSTFNSKLGYVELGSIIKVSERKYKDVSILPNNISCLYVIQLSESIKLNDNVYKIGRTKCIKKRIKNYPKGSRLLYYRKVDESRLCSLEQKLLSECSTIFKQELKHGKEYFRADLNMLKTMVDLVVNEKVSLPAR